MLTLKSSNQNGANDTYTYDALNRLSTVTDAAGQTTYTYDNVGNLQSYAYPNGVSTNYGYDALNRLTHVGSVTQSSTIASYTYTLEPAGNRTSVAELSGRTVSYGYDSLYRLTSESITADQHGKNGAVGYTYDSVGNRQQMTSTLNAIPAGLFNYNANDELTIDNYDSNGNTISSAGIQNTYDFENHLIRHGAVTIVYDGDGNRVSETVGGVTTNYLVDTQNPTGYAQVVDEVQNGAVVRTYSYGLERISETQPINSTLTTSFYGYDGHGSVRFLTNSAGAVTDSYDYDVFGNLINQTGGTPNVYLFAGEQYDPALGLYYNRARYLNTTTGRFWSMDAQQGSDRDPLSLHKYLYAEADPIDHLDPSGNQIDDIAASFAISAALNSMSTILLNSPLGNGVASFVASQLIPPDVIQALQYVTPDAVEVGAYGQANLNLRNPFLGATASAGVELLVSPKTANAALYGYYGAGITLLQTSTSGGAGGNLGLVFNCPNSATYTENFVSITVPIGALPPTIRTRFFEGVAQIPTIVTAGDIPVGFGSMLLPVIGLASTITPSSWNKNITIFFSPSSPRVVGASIGLSTSTEAATSNWSVTSSYYWQLAPSQSVAFR